MNRSKQSQPASVTCDASASVESKQVGKIRDRWKWTEAVVWTNPMLNALEQGVKGGKWFSLIDKVSSEENLFSGWVQVAENKGAAGVDRVSVEDFAKKTAHHMKRLSQKIQDGRYRPHDIRQVQIPKAGSKELRSLGIPTVRDRVVQSALRNVIEPIFERTFAEQSYGFRPNRGCKDALRRVDQLVKRGYRYVVDADLKSYFDTIPHDRLLERVAEQISDRQVLALIEQFLNQQVLGELQSWRPISGTPQGAVISPLLSNIYLNPLDHLLASEGFEMVRYADDFVILCQTESEAKRALEVVQSWVTKNGLQLHPTKTQIADTQGKGFDFLGYHFEREHRWPRKRSVKKLRAVLRDKMRRTDGRSLFVIISDVNRTLRGWFEYFKHSNRRIFGILDGWVRMRLRSILRKRAGRRGRGRGLDHHRYRNKFFEELGLYSLVKSHSLAVQSSKR